MQLEAAQFLIEVASCADIQAEIYEEYSGRGMYGATTAGISVSNPIALLGAAIEYVADGYDEQLEINVPKWDLHKLKMDSLGTGSILY